METVLLFLSAVVAASGVEDGKEDGKEDIKNQFVYDYESLRIGGLAFAVILFLLGILLILSRRCRCSAEQQKQRVPRDDEAQGENLIVSKAAVAAEETNAEI